MKAKAKTPERIAIFKAALKANLRSPQHLERLKRYASSLEQKKKRL